METILFIIFLSFALSTIINIILKKLNMSHIIGYIITGAIITALFDLNGSSDLHILDLIAEFGIVFLMFTIGLEMPINKLKKMKEILFVNGTIQVGVSAIVIFFLSKYMFDIDSTSSIIIALAFSLSSTAIVLTYLKQSKDIYTPYGEKATAILVFQDLAVIPILLLISFLANDTLSLGEILTNTFLSALLIILFMFTIGRKILNWFLDFSSRTRIEELFLASILAIVMGTSLLAHQLGFTYSLGAFIAGMIISETNYHIKVESDISSYKDLLLGAFFFSVGTKIDFPYLLSNIHYVFLIFFCVMVIKAVVIYLLMLAKSNKSDSIKAALSLCQIGEFSFAVFALAANDNIIDKDLASFLILVTVLSMILTPFIVNNIYKIASFFVVEYYESDKITPISRKNHTIICGYAILGRIIALELNKQNRSFVIISDNLKHVLLARKNGFMAYFGHLEKVPVLESLKVDEASDIIITTNNLVKKRLICEAVLNFKHDANLIVRIDSLAEKKELKDLNIKYYVHSQIETAKLMVEKSLSFSNLNLENKGEKI